MLGLFGHITKERNEVIFQGTLSEDPNSPSATWFEYEFTCKPGNINRRPCLITPYHYRIDWLLWFSAFQDYNQCPCIVHLMYKLLKGDSTARTLLALQPLGDPFLAMEVYDNYNKTHPLVGLLRDTAPVLPRPTSIKGSDWGVGAVYQGVSLYINHVTQSLRKETGLLFDAINITMQSVSQSVKNKAASVAAFFEPESLKATVSSYFDVEVLKAKGKELAAYLDPEVLKTVPAELSLYANRKGSEYGAYLATIPSYLTTKASALLHRLQVLFTLPPQPPTCTAAQGEVCPSAAADKAIDVQSVGDLTSDHSAHAAALKAYAELETTSILPTYIRVQLYKVSLLPQYICIACTLMLLLSICMCIV